MDKVQKVVYDGDNGDYRIKLCYSVYSPGIKEDEFEIKTGPEHEHVAEHFDFRYCAGRK